MSEPTVACIMLTRDRPEMAARAIRSFERQTYPAERRSLYVYDNGVVPCTDSLPNGYPDKRIRYHRTRSGTGRSIGALRNEAIQWQADIAPDIIATWDDDEIQHPNRLVEQVAFLQSGDYDAVGYNQMLFSDQRRCPVCFDHLTCPCGHGDTYLYTHPHENYCIGTSLVYWRRTWQVKPFPDLPQPGNPDSASEDTIWQSGLRCRAVSSLWEAVNYYDNCEIVATAGHFHFAATKEPRMIAVLHGGNYSMANYDKGIRLNDEFKQAPEWDEAVRAIVEAA